MKQFIGTKMLLAMAMTLGDYNALRGWSIPGNEDPNRKGYLVEYPLVGDDKPNHENFKGYISWSPKEAFESSYIEIPESKKNLQAHEQRVVGERTELIEKITKLHVFFRNPIFESLEQEDQDLLEKQVQLMMDYSDVLLKRINRF